MKLSDLDSQVADGTLVDSDQPTTMKLSQLEGMDTVDVTEDAVNGGLVETTPEQIASWQKRGSIGFMEQWAREDSTEKIPFWGGVEGAYKGFSVLNAVNRIKKAEYKDPLVQQEDYKKVNEFLLRAEEERVRGFSIGGNVTRGLANMPAFMIEFIATGGLATIGKMAVKKSLGKGIRTVAKNEVLSFATRLAGGAAGAATRTIGMPQRVLDGYTERQLSASVELTPKGLTIAKEVKEAPVTSFFKSWGDVAIENFSEAAGAYFGRYVAKPVKEMLPEALVKSMEKVFAKIPKNKAVQGLWTKAGYNGFLGEMGEERLGDIMRAVTGVQDFGAEDPHSMFDRLVASIPNGTDLLTEALVIAAPMGVTTAHQAIANRYSKKKINGVEVGKAKVPQLREITDAEAEKIVLATTDPTALKEQEVEEEKELGIITQQLFPEVVPEVAPESPATPQETTTPDAGLPSEESAITSSQKLTIQYGKQEYPIESVGQASEAWNNIRDEAMKEGVTSRDADTPLIKDANGKIVGYISWNGRVWRGEPGIGKQVEWTEDTPTAQPGPEGISEDILEAPPQKGSVMERIKLKLDAIQDKDQKANLARETLKQFAEMKKDMLTRRLNVWDKDGNRAEEYIDIPKEFLTKKGGVAPDELADELNNSNYGLNFESTTQMIDFLKEFSAIQKRLQAEISENRVQPITMKETTFLKQRISDILTGIREGSVTTRREIKDLQNTIVSMLQQSDLEAKDKAKFIATVKNIQTEKQFEKAVPIIQQRIAELENKASKRALKASIIDELSSTKTRKQSGKPVGKYTPDIQIVLDRLREASKMDITEAIDRLNVIMSDPSKMTPEIDFEARILDMRINFEAENPETLQEMLMTIQDIKAGGKALNEILQTERKERKEANVLTAVAELSGGKGLIPGAQTVGVQDKDASRNPFKDLLLNGVIGWNNILDWMSFKSGKKPGQSFLSKYFDVFKETRAAQKLKGDTARQMRDMYAEAYELKDDDSVVKKMREDTKPVFLGRFKNAKGEEVDLTLTKAQARKKVMELLDPSLAETFSSVDGMAYTQEIVKSIYKFMTVQDRVFIRKQLEFYNKFYSQINDVYRRMYGVNLPRNEFYSPIKRRGYTPDDSQMGEFLQEIQFRRSVNARSLKSRVKTILPLETTSDTIELEKHISEMGHFIVWAEKVRDMMDVFMEPRFIQAVKENYGSSEYSVMNNFIQDFARHGIDNAKRLNFFDWWRVRTTQTSLALRPVMLLKQLSSTPAYLSSMSPKEFTSGVIDFWKNPMKNIQTLREHPFFKYRADNIDRDLKAAMLTDAYKNWRKNPSFVNRLMLNVEIGDQLAIAMGGWAVYKKAIKSGMSHEQALEEFARVSNETQQSGDLSEQSVFQRAGSLARLFTMFMTSPNQYLRKEIMAVRNLMGKRISPKEAAKTIFIYHFMLPMLFQWVSDFGKFKGKEQLRAALMGSLNGLFIVGDLLEAVISKWLGIKGFSRAAIELPISKLFADTYKAITSIDPTDITEEDFWKAVDGFAGVAGFVTKVPIQQAKGMATETFEHLEEGEYWDAFGSAMGWSKYSLRDEDE